MLLILLVASLAAALMGGAWYGRLQERAWWTRRLLERGLNPNTLSPRGGAGPLEDVGGTTDATRDALEQMTREVERLAEGQRFITQVLIERKALPDGRAETGARGDARPDSTPGNPE